MNKVYRSVWNATTNTWAAAAETAKSRSKGSARAARRAVVALALGGASMGGAFAADVCTTEDGRKGALDTAGVCTVSSIGTMSGGIGTMASSTELTNLINFGGSTQVASTASGDASIALGSTARSTGTYSIAIGGATGADANGGRGALASGSYAIALGTVAEARANNSVALGDGSLADRANTVSVGAVNNRDGRTFTRQIVNVGAATQDTDAVNYGQMKAALAPKVDDTYIKVNNGAGANAGVAATANNSGSIAIGAGAVADAGGQNAAAGGGIAVGQGASAARSSVAIGTGSSAQAVAGQPTAAAYGNGSTANGAAATALGANSNATGTRVLAVGAQSSALADNGTAVGQQASVTANGTNSVALGRGSIADEMNVVSVGTTAAGGQRKIVNVAAGTQANDAVNFAQLSTKVDDNNVKVGGTAASTISGNTRNIAIGSGANANADPANSAAIAFGWNANADGAGAISMGSFSSATGSEAMAVGLRSKASADNAMAIGGDTSAAFANSVALGTGSATDRDDSVSVGNGTKQRQITNMAAGDLSATSTDAVNGSQLYATNQDVAKNTADIGTLNTSLTATNTNVTNLTGRVSTAENNITTLQQQFDSGTIGLVQQQGAGANLTVGKDTDGAAVDIAGTAGNRKLIGVADGAVSTVSKEAINGSQLRGVSDSVAAAIGGNASVNPDGSIKAPEFTVGDGNGGTKIVNNVGAAVTNLDDRVTTNEGSITTLQQQVGSGTIGLVQQAGAGANLTVGKDTDGTAVDFTGKAGARTLAGVADGAVTTVSKEAINGSQLRGVSDSVAAAIGGNASVNPDGSIKAPEFTVGDGNGGTKIVTNVGAAVTNLNDRVTTNEGDITNIRNDLSSGSIGLVQQSAPGADLTVGRNTDGTAVNFGGTAGDRVLTGVANGTKDNDAASIAQLKAMGLFDPNDGRALAAVVYDDIDLKNVTFGGNGGTFLNNVAPGLIASGSMQAVNGSQLYDMQQKYDQQFSNLNDRVGTIEQGVADGTIGNPGTGIPEGSIPSPGDGKDSVAVGEGSAATGEGSSAIGQGSTASGNNGSAIGQGSTASGDNSSAIGQGSTASGENSSAIGQGSSASGNNGSAIGQGSTASGAGGTAIGQGSTASGDRGTAIGQGSSATHNNSVALGAGSTTDRDNSVSVGSAGAERQITNVAAGTAPTDAVNVQQMNNTVHSARQDAMGGVAAAMAVAGLPQSSIPGRTFMAISGSTYGSEYGTAIGASYMTKDGKWVVKGAVNTSSRGEVGAVVGGGFYW